MKKLMSFCLILVACIITQNAFAVAPSITGVVTNSTQCPNCNGSINVTRTAGDKSPFTYLWSNGATTEDVFNLCAGTYSVTITDRDLKTASLTFTVTAPPSNLTASASITQNSICNGSCIRECFESATIPGIVNAQSSWTINQQAGTVTIRTTLAKTFVDNTYGTNAIGWPSGHTFSNLTGSDNLQLALLDANGVKKMEFKQDYITASNTFTSGYGTLGVTGGEGQILAGTAGDFVSFKTSLSENFNTFNYVLTTNSPATNATYTPNPAQPNWIFEVWYEATVKLSAFGAAGFGQPQFVSVHASPSKTGNNTEPVVDKGCCAYNCNGAINLSVNTGTGPFTFIWSTGATTEDISSLCPGDYTVTITDGNGCQKSQQFTVGQTPSGISASATSTANTTCSPECPDGGEQLCFESPTKPDIVNATSVWSINQQAGTITIRTTFAKTFVDNTYGTNAIGWPSGHTFSNLTGSDNLQLALYDANGVLKMDFKMDYITSTSSVPSGFATLGVSGGEGRMNTGSASDVVNVKTSLSENFNSFNYILTTNSPATNANYAPNATYPNWIFDVWYEATVKLSAFGAAGFGFPDIASVHASPSKTGQNSEPVDSVHCIPPCVRVCDGSINLTVNAGNGPFTYKWSTGATTEDISGLCDGSYTVTIYDANGCSSTLTKEVGSETCNDNNSCTVDACENAQCIHTPVVCNDNNSCTTDLCVNGECQYTPIVCNDQNPCTADACENGQCVYRSVICNDNDACTTDLCVNGQCQYTPINCGDNNSCTLDFCQNGQCQHTTINCVDYNPCTYDFCIDGECFNPLVSCSDNNACTIDECVNGSCRNTPVACNDNDPCTIDVCVGQGCQYTPINCNDDDPCTVDLCLGVDGCVNLPTVITVDVAGNHPSACGVCDGSATAIASGGTPPYTYLWSTGETTQSIGIAAPPFNGTSKCINAGSNAQFVAGNGDIFLADQNFSGSTSTYTNNIVADILGTTDDVLYRTERNNVSGTMTYSIPVINGPYDVQLHFAELFFGVTGGNTALPWTGKRVFNVSIEGNPVLTNYDINADVGPATATIKSFLANVADGFLTIQFTNVVNRAKVNGICVKPHQTEGGSAGLCAGTYSVTVTDSKGCFFQDDVDLSNENCEDGNTCTIDICNNNACVHVPVVCNDFNSCTNDQCVQGEGCVYTPVICNDHNACTTDQCLNGQCQYTPITCNDDNSCTSDACVNGQCQYTPIVCNDANSCTTDNCVSGQCQYTPVVCNDQNSCTTDNCSPTSGCFYTPIVCNDQNSCTTDECVNGQCQYTPLVCNDGIACTNDQCVNGQCQYTPIVCDDFNPCTSDLCVNGQCQYTGTVCNDQNPCTNDECVVGGQCVYTPVVCNDGNSCTTDLCVNGQCQYTPIVCNDQNACTNDACVSGQCQYTSIVCNDQNSCTNDYCLGGVCVYQPLNCDDQNPCTTDGCLNGQCTHNGVQIGVNITKDDVSCACQQASQGPDPNCVLTYDGLQHGAFISNQFAAYGVTIRGNANNHSGALDTVIVFNSNLSGTADPDLEADLGNLLILPDNITDNNNNQLVDNPNDWAGGGTITYTFSAPHHISSFVFVDNDQSVAGLATAYDEFNGVITSVPIPITANGAWVTVVVNADDVRKLVVTQNGSGGAVGKMIFCEPACCDGSATAEGNSGTAPYSYHWSTGANTATVNGLCPGTYYVTVTDFNGCQTVSSITIGNEDCQNPCLGVNCDDQDPCTTDDCAEGICSHTPIPGCGRIPCISNTQCYDNDACTVDICAQDGFCANTTVVCNDGNACTTDNCSPTSGCFYTPIVCNDQNSCTTDLCVNGQCQYTPIVCNDNNECTTDACVNGQCVYTPIQGCGGCPNAITSLTLVRPGLGGDIGTLTDGAIISYETLCSGFSIRANACLTVVKSARFVLNASIFRTESSAPYAINGDNAGSYNAWTPAPGFYTLTVIPYTGTGASGTAGTPITVTFTVVGTTTCNDQDACTTDACNRTTGLCAHVSIPGCGQDPCAGVTCNDNNTCTTDACSNGQCIYTPIVCNDQNSCTNDACVNGQCVYTPVVCNDQNSCTNDACVNGQCVYTPVVCNDQNSCTNDACVNGQCQYTPIVCNDADLCTSDACVNGQCQYTPVTCNDGNACTANNCSPTSGCFYTPIVCNDNNQCTSDACLNGECTFTQIPGCGGDPCSAFYCDDQNPCTVDVGNGVGGCTHTPVVNTPDYLRLVNTTTNSLNLKVLYGATSSWVNKNVIAGGNNTLCITLRDATNPGTMSKVHVRLKGSLQTEATRITNNYPVGCVPRGWTTICIPLSNYPTTDFTALPYVEIFNSAAGPYELQILKIEFTGGATPFLWFGGSQTNNYVSGNTASFFGQLVTGGPCNGAPKLTGTELNNVVESLESEISSLEVYPNPFNNRLMVEFVSKHEGKAEVRIVDVLGQIVKREALELFEGENERQIDVDGTLADGMYFLELRTGEEVKYVKLYKSR